MTGAEQIVDDLRAESDALDALVAPLSAEQWGQPTPAAGWTIAHQIAHLLWTDRVALTSITDEAEFGRLLTTAMADPAGFVDRAAEELAATPRRSCWPTGAPPGPDCMRRCGPCPPAASCCGSARR